MMFKSADHALKWAFQVSGTPIVKMSSINSMRGAEGGGNMTPHDRHAQAAIILSIVEKAVDVNGLAYLKARYGRELQGGEEQRAVADVLVRVAMAAMPTGMHNRRGVEKLVRIYFGQEIGIPSVRKDLGCGNTKAHEIKKAVFDGLDAIGARAFGVLDDEMRRVGLILEEIAA